MKLSAFEFTVRELNAVPIGGFIVRSQVLNKYTTHYGYATGTSNVTIFLNMFLTIGYTQATSVPGTYTVCKHLTDPNITTRNFEAEYNKFSKRGLKAAESIALIQLSSPTLFNLEYQVIKFTIELKLNYIQGCILKYIVQYKDDIKFLHKIKHMAQYAFYYDLEGGTSYNRSQQTLYEFVQINKLDDTQAALIKLMYENKYTKIIDYVDDALLSY